MIVDTLNFFTCHEVPELEELGCGRKEKNQATESGTLNVKQDEKEHYKIVIFVDELDRCLPEVQMAVLERLYNLRKIKNCMIVCMLNEEQIAKTYNTMYGCSDSEYEGRNYLRKFFKQHIHLDMNNAEYFKMQIHKRFLSESSDFTLSNNEVEWVQSIIFNILSVNRGKTKRLVDNKPQSERPNTKVIFDNRAITRMLDDVCRILQNSKDIDFAAFSNSYLIILLYVSFSKVYNSTLYQFFKKGKGSGTFYDFAWGTSCEGLEKSKDTEDIVLYGVVNHISSYSNWRDMNIANLMINIWLVHNTYVKYSDLSTQIVVENIVQSGFPFELKNEISDRIEYNDHDYGLKGNEESICKNLGILFEEVDKCILGNEY